MDRQRKKKLQNARVIMTNIFMGISVIGLVFVLMLVAMGYGFDEKGNFEQSGLIQISSNPKGATVEIDGDTQFSRTDFNKMLSNGDHHVKISKAGYDTWEKTINVDAGLLTRVEWARLFPIKTEISTISTFSNLRLAEFSSDRKHLFTIEHNATVGEYSSLQGEKVNSEKVSLHEALNDNSEKILEGTIKLVSWNESGNKVLLTWAHDGKTTWHLVDLENADRSVNLNKKFGMTFTDIHISNDSASKLWALENGNIHIIDMGNQTVSGVLVSDVEQFTNNKDVIGYVGLDGNDHNYRKISVYKEGEKGSTTILNLKEEKPSITMTMGSYWNESWIAYSVNNHISVHSGTYPSFDRPSKNSLKEFLKRDLEYTPNLASTNQLGRIVIFTGNTNITSVDIETRDDFDTATEKEVAKLNWLDGYLIWENVDNKIVIRDFDGDNRREILSVNNDQPINITENNRWLYFFEIEEADADENGEAKEATKNTPSSETIYILKRQKLD
ncbi:MAG: PEGA domain-containing protein [Candidatus Saccharibacteria bacterium]|nr:PEGA domain-containing protein [Candidatus Saccharibacteria bacterium]